MKKMITLFSCLVTLFTLNTAKAQVLFSESFNLAGGFTAQGWTLINADGLTNNATVQGLFGTTSSFVINADLNDPTDSVAMSTSWFTSPGTANDWMITPMVAGVATNGQLSWEANTTDVSFPDGYQVWVATSIAGPTPVVTDFTTGGIMVYSTPSAPSGTTWGTQTVSLAAYNGMNVWVAFRNNSTDKYVLQLDNVLIENQIAADDLEATSHSGEYTIIPFAMASAMPLEALVTNVGTNDLTDAVLTANVYLNGGIVQTTSSPATAMIAGATATLNAGTYTPATVGAYNFEYIVSTALGTDVDAANDTIVYSFYMDQNYYARDDANVTLSIGVGAGAFATIGNIYEVTANTIMDSVLYFRNGILGDTTKVEVFSVSGGLPTTMIGNSVQHIFTTADSSSVGAVYTQEVTDLLGNPLVLTPGTYFVGVKEFTSTANMGLGCTDQLFTPNTVFGQINGGAFGTLESFGFPNTAVVRPRFDSSCNTFAFMPTTTDAGCGLSDGTATANPSNGTAPYTYDWTNAGNQTTATATGLAAGVYYVNVTDNAGCTGSDTITVINPNAPTGTTNVTDATCGQADGTATATSTGGTAPYTYVWDANAGSQTTATVTGLAAGTYSVVVTDAANCTVTLSATVNTPTGPTSAAAETLPVSCNSGSDGEATATGTGGTGTYTYLWDAAAGNQTTATATGLAAGTYNVTITDGNGCTSTSSVIVTEPTALTATSVDNFDGSVTATPAGGTAPYTYLWDDAASQTTATATGLNDNQLYTVTITDGNGCTTTSSVTATLGLEDLDNTMEVKAFPNPAGDQLTIVYTFSANENAMIRLYNNLGQIVETRSLTHVLSGQLEFNTSGIAAGIYRLEVSTSQGSVAKPIVIAH